MMKKTMVLVLLCLLLGGGSAAASIPIFKLDLNHPDNNTAAETEEGFTPFTVNDSGTTVNGVTVEFGGTLDSRRRAAPTGVPFEQIYRDFFFSRPGGLTVTLSGLMPNALYEVTVYAFDTSSAELRVGDWMSEGELVLQAQFLNTEPPVEADDYGFTGLVSASTSGRIVLEVVAGEGTREVSGASHPFAFLNALALSLVADPANASNPNPANQATDVPYETPLSWTPGQFAQTHDVYFGTAFDDVNDADRANPLGALVSQGQTGATYDPDGVLEFGQTYYWRVDEVNGAPDNTIYQGDVLSFTVEPLSYPIEDVVATSNGISNEDAGPESTINGSGLNDEDQHSTESSDMWLASPGDEPLYIQFEFDKIYKLHEMLVWNYNVGFELVLGFGLKDVVVEYSADGTDWAVLGEVELAQGTAMATYAANTAVDFGGVGAKYVKLTVNSGHGVMGQFGLSEVRFLSIPVQAREPQPADGVADVAVTDAALNWRAGREAVAHEVYLSTDEQAVIDGTALINTVDTPGLDADGLLELAQTYYWKVNEVNEAETASVWEGDVWSFSTQVSIVVEDFESYDDDENRIYDTWLDGWVNDTGSTVGYLDAPFAEQTIVHGGGQSMPLTYENTGGVTVSEATRTFEGPQDWTQYGIKGLTLWFYGDASNTATQLYVKINGSKVIYDGDSDSLLQATWQLWYIDVDDLAGANLGSVRELTIGLEGGEGLLLIDDLVLSPLERQLVTPVEPAPEGLVAHYALDGNAADSVAGHSGTLVGEPTFVPGQDGQAIKLNGVADYVHVESSFDLPVYSASLWFRVDGGTAERDVLSVYDAAGDHGILLEVRTNGELRYLHRAPLGTSTGTDLYSGGVYDDGTWYHVAMVKSAGTTTLYVNGVSVGSAADENEFGAPLQNLTLGVLKHDNLIRYLPGAIDEVYLYSRALSHAEIAWLAGRTLPFDSQ